MTNKFIHVEVILPSQDRSPLTINSDYIVSFTCSQGAFTEVVTTRSFYIIDMPYDEFVALLQRVNKK